jgi:hypothetical protein
MRTSKWGQLRDVPPSPWLSGEVWVTKDPRRGAAGEVGRGEDGALEGHRLQLGIASVARERGLLLAIEGAQSRRRASSSRHVADAVDRSGRPCRCAPPPPGGSRPIRRSSTLSTATCVVEQRRTRLSSRDELEDKLADGVGLAGARGALEKGEVLGAERLQDELSLLVRSRRSARPLGDTSHSRGSAPGLEVSNVPWSAPRIASGAPDGGEAGCP